MKPKKEFSAGSLAAIGVDIGKEVFHIVGLGIDGKIAFRKKVRRFGFEDAFEKLPRSSESGSSVSHPDSRVRARSVDESTATARLEVV